MYNSPHFRVGTVTLACVLLLSSSGSHLLYADNDSCFKKAKCPKAAKPRRGKARPTQPQTSPPQPGASTHFAGVRKRPDRKKPPQPRGSDSFTAVNQSFVLPTLPSDQPAVGLPLPGNSLNPSGSYPLPRTEGTRNNLVLIPDNGVEGTIRRGYELINAGKHTEARKQFESILKVSPRNMQAHNGIGDAYMVKGEHSKAIEAYRKALSFDPQNTALYEKLKAAVAIEKERDNVVRNKVIVGLLQIGLIGVLGAVAPTNSQVKTPQFRNRPMTPLNQPK